MKKYLIFCMVMHSLILNAQQQEIRGRVTDQQSNQPLVKATVAIKNANIVVVTDEDGRFILPHPPSGTFRMIISHAGYETVELSKNTTARSKEMNIQLLPLYKTTDSVVVSASRRTEKITDAPASIQVIGQKDLNRFAGSNVGELAAYVQGIEFVRMGVDNVSFNARGLNNAFNNKVFQIVDGRNSMSPLSGSLLLGNNVSANKEDIERIEILLGPQTALYGPNVHNAHFNYITKDPRKYPGTTLAVTAGNQNQFSARLRQAGKFGNKWAYKITGEKALGRDFEFYDSIRGVGGGVYGPLDTVAERIDFNFRRIRGEAHLYYNLTPKATIIVSSGGTNTNTINTTTAGHNQFVDMSNQFVQVRFTSPRLYTTISNAWANFGNSYNVLNYTRDFHNRTHSEIRNPGDPRFSTQGFLATDAADASAKRLSRFKETPQRFNAEAQYNHSFIKQRLYVVAGLFYQKERPRGYGVNLVDSFQRIYVTQFGAVLQADQSLPWKVRFIGAARVDNHSNFGTYVSPKVGLMKTLGTGNVRLTWGRAISVPSILYQYASTANFFFGNGEGINYIPNGVKFTDTASFKVTRPLEPEEVKTWEIGYKGKLLKRFSVDITFFSSVSRNFFSPSIQVNGRALSVGDKRVTHNPLFAGQVDGSGIVRNARFSTIFNFGNVKVYGLDIGTNLEFSSTVNFALKYSWLGSNISKGPAENDANADGWLTADEKSLNSPRHRGAAILTFEKLFKQKGFATVAARYVERYDFYSGSQISTKAGEGNWGEILTPNGIRYAKNFNWGPLGGFTTFDVRAGYRLNTIITTAVNITNVLNTRQREFAGSPLIRRLISFELKADVR